MNLRGFIVSDVANKYAPACDRWASGSARDAILEDIIEGIEGAPRRSSVYSAEKTAASCK
jgi:hypothetical protein